MKGIRLIRRRTCATKETVFECFYLLRRNWKDRVVLIRFSVAVCFVLQRATLARLLIGKVKLLIPLMRFALCKEQTVQAKRNVFCKIMVYFSVAPPPTLVGWADCM